MTTQYEQRSALRQREPIWPIAAAWGLLLASSAGVVVTISGGEQSDTWYTHPWLWLGSLAVLTMALAVAVFCTRRRMRRRMQTALAVSLILHLLLTIYLKDQVLALVLSQRDDMRKPQVKPLPTVPDYFLPAPSLSRPVQPFERPTEASFQGQLSQLHRQRQIQSVNAQQAPSQLAALAAAVPNDRLRRRSTSAPRESRELSLRRRQDNAVAQPQVLPIEHLPTFKPPSASSARDAATPQALSASRQRSESTSPRQPASPNRRADLRAANSSGPARRPQSAERAVNASSLPSASLLQTQASAAPAQLADTTVARVPDAAVSVSGQDTAILPSAPDLARREPRSPGGGNPTENDSPVPLGAAASQFAEYRRQSTISDKGAVAIDQPTRSLSLSRVGEATAEDVELPPMPTSPSGAVTRQVEPSLALARRGSSGRSTVRSQHTAASPAGERADAGEVSRAEVGAAVISPPRPQPQVDRSLAGGADFRPLAWGPDSSYPSHRASAAKMSPGDAVAESVEVDFGGQARASEAGDETNGNPEEMANSSTSGAAAGAAGNRDVAPSSDSLARAKVAWPTRVDAPVGVGGLADVAAITAGVTDRRASPRSDIADEVPSRLLADSAGRPRSGQLAELGGPSRRAAAPFAGRIARHRPRNPEDLRGAPSEQTEATVERGLQYLARVQHQDGRWSLQGGSDKTPSTPLLNADTAATGLALLAFLGAGYDHYDGKYQKEVFAGLQWMRTQQQANGDFFNRQAGPANHGIWLYSHGIAAIALCEAYGMTGDKQLKPHAQKGLDFIVAAQHPTLGGWRYAPGGVPDLSVSGWQLMALRSGQLAGLDVPADTMAGVRRLLDSAYGGEARYVYSPWSQDPARATVDRSPTSVMTSVGLLMRLYSGSDRHDAEIQQGAGLLAERLPTARPGTGVRSMQNPNRDAYYWYNATQVMFHMRGERWAAWRDALYPLLAESQEITGAFAGSWDPFQPTPDRWAQHAGRLYVTTMNLLSLEVYYRHLPLYDDGLAVTHE